MRHIKRFGVAFYAAFALCLAGAQAAFATAAYGKLTENVGEEVGAAVPVALAAVGIFVGILVAYKLARRMIRA
jgi:Na+/glutamate symporter